MLTLKSLHYTRIYNNHILLMTRSCNLCDFCHNGNYQYCLTAGINSTIGIWKDGGWAQYVVVPQQQIFVLPDEITTEQGMK